MRSMKKMGYLFFEINANLYSELQNICLINNYINLNSFTDSSGKTRFLLIKKQKMLRLLIKKYFQMKKKKINIQFQKNESQLYKPFDKIDIDSLELFREMMSTRFNKNMED